MNNLPNFGLAFLAASEQLRLSTMPLRTAIEDLKRQVAVPIKLPDHITQGIINARTQRITLQVGAVKLAEDIARLTPPLGTIFQQRLNLESARRREFIDSLENLRVARESLKFTPTDWSLLSGEIDRPKVRRPRTKKKK